MKGFIDIIRLHVYPQDVILCFNVEDDEIVEFLDFNEYKEPDYGQFLNRDKFEAGLSLELPDGNVILKIKNHPNYRSTITHESIHAAFFILHRLGFELELGVSDEAYTYLIEYISEEIHKKIELFNSNL